VTKALRWVTIALAAACIAAVAQGIQLYLLGQRVDKLEHASKASR
jgi:hypothetical protein